MQTAARQALNALIDDLVAAPGAIALPAPRPEPVAQAPTPPPPVAALQVDPSSQPLSRPVAQAYDALPAGARSAILWRSRTT